jgi:hypothetical protein
MLEKLMIARIPGFIWKSKIHYRIHKIKNPLVPILSYSYSVHNFLPNFSNIRFTIISHLHRSRPDEIDFFNRSNPPSRTMALGLTQLLIEMSTRNFPRG